MAFVKGKSGNPHGRLKGVPTRKTALRNALIKHSGITGQHCEVDTITKLCFSHDEKTSSGAFDTLKLWIRGKL